MKVPFKSIRWRLQLWHGAILVVVLAAFGSTAYRLARENRFHLIDQEIQRHTDTLFDAIAPFQDPDGRKSVREGATNNFISPTNLVMLAQFLNPRFSVGKANLPENGEFYYAFWDDQGLIRRSRSGPKEIPPPSTALSGISTRTRGEFRESMILTKMGPRIIVGRSISGDMKDLHRQAGLMILLGSGIALFGLVGGWWMASSAIKPIKAISVTAQKITSGNLSERINVSDTDNELGELAAVLNSTFDRLQSAFDQLKCALDRQTEFTADASHELRTPLSVLLAETSSTLSRERTPAEYRESMEFCRQAARRMHQLTESLLLLARLDSTEGNKRHAAYDLEGLLRNTLDSLKPLASNHGVSLHAELVPACGIGNADQIGQVASNLINNATYYNHPGGNVWVKVVIEGKEIVFSVSDDGQGIAAEDIPHIFERFYRADKARSRSGGRVGLGLAIAKSIIDSHSGAIRVSSALGKGSVFTVRLPGCNSKIS